MAALCWLCQSCAVSRHVSAVADLEGRGGGEREIPASVKNACRLFSCLLWEGAGGGNVREQDAHLVWSNKSPRAHGSPWQGEHATTVTKKLLATSTSPIMHLICPPKILHNLCFSFLLGITAVPREIENSVYAKFGGQIRCIMGDV